MWCYRRLLKIPWTEKKTNKDIIQMADVGERLLQQLMKRKLRYAGQIMRGSSGPLLQLSLEGKIERKRGQRMRRRNWMDDVKEWSGSTSYGDKKRKAENREEWRDMVANLRTEDGTWIIIIHEKRLYTPGPLKVTLNVKEAMLRDVGSRDNEFIECIKYIRHKLIDIAGVSQNEFCCIPVQGSGTFAVDAAFQTALPKEGAKALVIENGSYGKRMVKIYESAGIEGVPGFAFIIARNSVMAKCKRNSRSLALDLYDQVTQLDKTSQFRFTPPTHSMLAFKRAQEEFEAEGRVDSRSKRYAANRDVLREGMTKLGFKELLDPSVAGCIITSYKYPADPNFNFPEFYNRLNEKGLMTGYKCK
ncbi:2-aminoethylphosphonate--pyruvate transaminase [Elysia marginata]|uniref:2-aminoethylphosphonate--pyruvate transaminase n=1 Tax=Elysia marginata TaxID=1093978 RepID=A0AAV4JSS9_9GAST|nr:2-aminoethylphosphonate--pyruvate transaminase [Elysia marginata]